MVGGYAQYVAVEDDNVAYVPDPVPLDEASIIACAIRTVLNAIGDVGYLAAGESALVTGAGGGLGVHAIQLARLAGAFLVAVTTLPEKARCVARWAPTRSASPSAVRTSPTRHWRHGHLFNPSGVWARREVRERTIRRRGVSRGGHWRRQPTCRILSDR